MNIRRVKMTRGNGIITINELAKIAGCSHATVQVNADKLRKMMEK